MSCSRLSSPIIMGPLAVPGRCGPQPAPGRSDPCAEDDIAPVQLIESSSRPADKLCRVLVREFCGDGVQYIQTRALWVFFQQVSSRCVTALISRKCTSSWRSR